MFKTVYGPNDQKSLLLQYMSRSSIEGTATRTAPRCAALRTVAHPDGSDTGAIGPIEAEVLAHPAIVAGQGGVNGQVAVSLARRIDQQADPGSGMASLSRALAVEIATLDDRPANWQPSAVDELISRRSRRDEQLARRYARDA